MAIKTYGLAIEKPHAPVTWLEVKPLGHILRDEYARLVVKNEAALAARIERDKGID